MDTIPGSKGYLTFPVSVPGHPGLPPGMYLVDGIGTDGRVINPRPATTNSVQELLPWQRAVLRLHNRDDMLRGAWTWRQVRVPDAEWAEAEGRLVRLVGTLLALGAEFSVSVWRPTGSDKVSPEDYRLALVTWGEYLDMVADEIYDKMNRDYAVVPE